MKNIRVIDNNGVLVASISFDTKEYDGYDPCILVGKKPISISIDGSIKHDVKSGKDVLEYVLAYAYSLDKMKFKTKAVPTGDYYVFHDRPSRDDAELMDLSGGSIGIKYDKKIGNKEVISDVAQAMLDFNITSIVIIVRCTSTYLETSVSPSTTTTPVLPLVKYISGFLKDTDLLQEIGYARRVINASRYPQFIEFHIDTIPVFLVSRDDMDRLSPPEKIVNPLFVVAERIVVSVLEYIFSSIEDNNNSQEYNNPINSTLEYLVCEANVSSLAQDERDELANVIRQLIDAIIKLINEIVVKDPNKSLEDVTINNQLIDSLLEFLLPLFANFLGKWMRYNNEYCHHQLRTILRHAFKARRSFFTLGLYCPKNPAPEYLFKDIPGDYSGPTIFLCPDRICKDRRIEERGIAFAKTMIHEFCHAYMDVSEYGPYDEIHHCIEESYANALTLRVFETFAYETNNYLSGIGKKSTLTVVKELMSEQPKDYALGVPLFEKRTYFPERWRDNKAKVSIACKAFKDGYLDVVYLRHHQNLCISNILDSINGLLQ